MADKLEENIDTAKHTEVCRYCKSISTQISQYTLILKWD